MSDDGCSAKGCGRPRRVCKIRLAIEQKFHLIAVLAKSQDQSSNGATPPYERWLMRGGQLCVSL